MDGKCSNCKLIEKMEKRKIFLRQITTSFASLMIFAFKLLVGDSEFAIRKICIK